jgi:hypothetical protein
LLSKIEHFEKMAIVGAEELEGKLKEMFEFLTDLIPDVKVKFFGDQQLETALDWLKERKNDLS